MNGEIGAALIQTIGTLIAAGGAGWGIFYQLGRQGEQSREAIMVAESRKLRSQMCDESIAASRALTNSAIELSTKLMMVKSYLWDQIDSKRIVRLPAISPVLFQELLDLDNALSEQTSKFVVLLENRRIIDPRLIIFRDALSCVLHEHRELTKTWFPVVIQTLPGKAPNGAILAPPFSEDRARAAMDTAEKGTEVLTRVVSIMEDFNVDIQNLLLGDIFANKVQHRNPPDPSAWVVTIENYDAVRGLIAATPWGVLVKKHEEEAFARFGRAVPIDPLAGPEAEARLLGGA